MKISLSTEIEGEARKISCLHCKGEEYVTTLKVVIGVGHAEDGPEFNHLVGFDLSTQALRGKDIELQLLNFSGKGNMERRAMGLCRHTSL